MNKVLTNKIIFLLLFL